MYFPGAPSAPITVALDGVQAADALVFNVSNSNGYTLAQGDNNGNLTLGTSAGGSITVAAGSHTIPSAPMTLGGDLTVGVAGGAALQLAGSINELSPGTNMFFNGPGPTALSSAAAVTGNVNINGGVLKIMPGGQLSAYDEQLNYGGTSIVQCGGTNSLADVLYIQESATGYPVSYCLKGGTVTASEESVGYYGAGVFDQSGGTNNAGLVLEVGGYGLPWVSGTYNLCGGLVSATSEIIPFGGSGVFNQTGGTNSVGSGGLTLEEAGTGSTGTYNLLGGLLSVGALGAKRRHDNLQRRRRNATGRRVFRHDLAHQSRQLGKQPDDRQQQQQPDVLRRDYRSGRLASRRRGLVDADCVQRLHRPDGCECRQWTCGMRWLSASPIPSTELSPRPVAGIVDSWQVP